MTGDGLKAIGTLFAAFAFPAALSVAPAHADTNRTTFAIMRNGDQIGTSTIDLAHNGPVTTVDATTHINVTIAFIPVYHFDQSEAEQWSNRQLWSLRATTDDDGNVHQTSAGRAGNALTVTSNGRQTTAPATTIPLDLWNPSVLSQSAAIDPLSGTVVPVKVTDRGQDTFASRGRTTRAHHYVITAGTFAQDVWYDPSGKLVGIQLTGRDGSTIRYELT